MPGNPVSTTCLMQGLWAGCHAHLPFIDMGVRDPNSGPHTCMHTGTFFHPLSYFSSPLFLSSSLTCRLRRPGSPSSHSTPQGVIQLLKALDAVKKTAGNTIRVQLSHSIWLPTKWPAKNLPDTPGPRRMVSAYFPTGWPDLAHSNPSPGRC